MDRGDNSGPHAPTTSLKLLGTTLPQAFQYYCINRPFLKHAIIYISRPAFAPISKIKSRFYEKKIISKHPIGYFGQTNQSNSCILLNKINYEAYPI